jgi:hypothetical protein
MYFRLAVMQDLPRLKTVYKDIIQNMIDNQIEFFYLMTTKLLYCTTLL